jgi:putative hydrolase of the HAD superfamily
MQYIKAVLFDLYDTLTYVDIQKYQKKVEMCAKICSVPIKAFEEAWKSLIVDSNLGKYRKTEDRVRTTLRLLGISDNQEYIDAITKIEHDFLESGIFLFEDSISTLMSLRNLGLKLSLITNASPSVRIVLNKYNIDEYIDCVIISSDVGLRKPDHRIYKISMERLKVRAQECFFVGDGNDGELDGAHELGITTICVNHTLRKYIKLKDSAKFNIDFTVKSLGEAVDIIKSFKV